MRSFSKLVVGLVLSICIVGGITLLADAGSEKSLPVMSADEVIALWQNRAAAVAEEKVKPFAMSDHQELSAAMAGPNALVHGVPASPPGENNNSSVSWDEVAPGMVYSVFNEFAGPGVVPSLIGSAFSPAGGIPGSWANLGPVPPGPFPAEFNSTISSHPFGGHLSVGVGYGAVPAYMGPGGIVMSITAGGGAPFGAWVGPIMPSAGGAVPGGDWVDYPQILMDDVPGNPAPGFGSGHMAWVHYFDFDGDPDGDGNPFNDGDGFEIMYSYTNTLAGAFLFPGFAPPVAISPVIPLYTGVHSDHRPAIAITGPPGTPFPVGMPPGALYCAWYDPLGGGIWVDASPAPAAGAPWGVLPPGPVIPTGPPIPPVIPNGPPTMVSSGVSMMIDWGGMCPGTIYICWADMTLGDGDIWFTSSPDGGITWIPAVRVNCDPPGIGAMQWAPKMTMDQTTGEIVIVYNDQRSVPGGATEQWASVSRDCGVTWTDALVSDKGPMPTMSTFIGPPGPAGAFWMGDYLGADFAITAPTTYGYTFNDGRNGADQDVQFEAFLDIDFDCDGFPVSIDCDDTDPTVFPGAVEIMCDGKDNDCSALTPDDVDVDGDGVTVCAGDCDDSDPTVFPGAPEIMCDGIDQNCNGLADDDADVDGDGVTVCAGDCDDSDPTVFPGAVELCDGVDNNCNTLIDEGFDTDGDGWTTCAGDCDDTNPAVFPGAVEVCDGVDNNCNTLVDEGFDTDSDGWTTCAGDCDDTNPAVFPGAVEVCDGIDNDCNTIVDDPGAVGCVAYFADADGDTYGDAASPLGCFCSPPPGSSTNSSDCDDSNPLVNPGATENCTNTIDDDCNGLIDAADPACVTGACCVVAGDADGGGSVTIGDVTYLIAYIFAGGTPPGCCEEGDANGGGTITIGDVTYLIARIFSGGPAPICGPPGMTCTGH